MTSNIPEYQCLQYTTAEAIKLVDHFYIHGSVHRNYINKIQQDATVCRYLFTAKSLSTYCWCPSHLSTGVHKTVTAASGTGHITYLCNNLPPVWPTRPFYRVTIVMFSHTLKNLTPVIVIIRLHAYMSIFIRSNYIQQYAGIYLLQNYSTCFGCPSHPSS